MTRALVLIGINGSRAGTNMTFTERTTIVGSSPECDLVLSDYQVAPRHAELRQTLGRWFVAALDPRAQTYLNGKRVQNQSRINEGDLLTIGSASFRTTTSEIRERVVGASSASESGVPLLGQYLIRRGYITARQLEDAVRRQEELHRQGRGIQLGDLIYEMGLINRGQLHQVLQEQRSDFLEHFKD